MRLTNVFQFTLLVSETATPQPDYGEREKVSLGTLGQLAQGSLSYASAWAVGEGRFFEEVKVIVLRTVLEGLLHFDYCLELSFCARQSALHCK